MRSRIGATRKRVVLVALPAAAALNAGSITLMGGDYVHAQLMIGPFFAACAPMATVPLARRFVVSLVVMPWAVLCAFTLRSADSSAWADSPFVVGTGHGDIGSELNGWEFSVATSEWLSPSGTYLQEDPQAEPVRLQDPPAPGLATPTDATYWVGPGRARLPDDPRARIRPGPPAYRALVLRGHGPPGVSDDAAHPPSPETAYHRFWSPGTPANVRSAEA
jgi:hypothetical protein